MGILTEILKKTDADSLLKITARNVKTKKPIGNEGFNVVYPLL